MTVNVTDQDYIGPISSEATNDTDIYLILSFIFVISFGLYTFSQTSYGEIAWAQSMSFLQWTVFKWFKWKQE